MQNTNPLTKQEDKIEGFFNILLCLTTDPIRFFSQTNLENQYEKFFKYYVIYQGILLLLTIALFQFFEKIMLLFNHNFKNGALENIGINYILWILIFMPIGAIIVWYISGFFFNLRIRFSGGKEYDRNLSRIIWICGHISLAFIGALLLILTGIIVGLSIIKGNVLFAKHGFLSSINLILSFYTCYIQYVGVVICLKVSRNKACFWFIFLPMLYSLLSFIYW